MRAWPALVTTGVEPLKARLTSVSAARVEAQVPAKVVDIAEIPTVSKIDSEIVKPLVSSEPLVPTSRAGVVPVKTNAS